ncbi:helix-turn-helix transcriptional regulator [Sinomicrobium soli]|uniref:helix-turn-helix transcriptional regulator n=1 Tax=Sinomicrobium sp. N-1-3-6 TaxID=2219864 RepID=UPI000DCB4A51|nr:AraC family transcriptional regulator [Sinomicrobium sp. N-1-3-6]RAV27400.1 hypothetical protein DN748_18830 [Sinomicrobium sp. N-1-3-6]
MNPDNNSEQKLFLEKLTKDMQSEGIPAYKLRVHRFNEEYRPVAQYLDELVTNIHSTFMAGIHRISLPAAPYREVDISFLFFPGFRFAAASETVLRILGREPGKDKDVTFESLLTETSQHCWKRFKNHTRHDAHIRLSFHINDLMYCPILCHFKNIKNKLLELSAVLPLVTFPAELLPLVPPFDPQAPHSHPKARLTSALLPVSAEQEGMEKVARYIQDHLDGSLPTLNDIARHFGINSQKLNKNFRATFLQSVYAYYQDRRLDKAMFLLRTTNQPIMDIAYSIGYSVHSGFYRVFRKKFGITPGQVRKKR